MTPLLDLRGLTKEFPVRRGLLRRQLGTVRALAGVDLAVRRGESLALVGESGSGKTTLARCAIRLLEPTAGEVRFGGEDLLALPPAALRRQRRRFQMVFQDPYGSLDPRQRVDAIVAEPLAVHGLAHGGAERRHRMAELLASVGLPPAVAGRYPHELSGGQRQRVGIARALAPRPELLLADEPISALDVSVRAQILNLLAGLQERLGLTLVLIAHDLAAVEQVADRVAVLYLGRLVELGPRERVFSHPLHPYTASLLSAVPVPDPASRRRRELRGEPPSLAVPPAGCVFHPRCPIARPRCAVETPVTPETPETPETAAGEEHTAACFYPGEAAVRRTAAGPT